MMNRILALAVIMLSAAQPKAQVLTLQQAVNLALKIVSIYKLLKIPKRQATLAII